MAMTMMMCVIVFLPLTKTKHMNMVTLLQMWKIGVLYLLTKMVTCIIKPLKPTSNYSYDIVLILYYNNDIGP